MSTSPMVHRVALVIAAVAVPMGGLAPATPAGAAGDPMYGAVALSFRDDVSGLARNYAHKTKAIDAALRACEQAAEHSASCHKIVWVRHGCAAVAVRYRSDGTVSRYGWGIGRRRRTAVHRAERFVGSGAVLHTWLCTKR